MIDHAQAKINLINAALQFTDLVLNVKSQACFVSILDDADLACLKQLKRAAEEYKKTKQPKRIDEGDEFDSLHGTG
jgi:hypothetical protein